MTLVLRIAESLKIGSCKSGLTGSSTPLSLTALFDVEKSKEGVDKASGNSDYYATGGIAANVGRIKLEILQGEKFLTLQFE